MVCFCFVVDQTRKVRQQKPAAGICSRCGGGASVADMPPDSATSPSTGRPGELLARFYFRAQLNLSNRFMERIRGNFPVGGSEWVWGIQHRASMGPMLMRMLMPKVLCPSLLSNGLEVICELGLQLV
ncbi:hypothetical protein SASPL_127172 [Salvia splendens]|uniref:Uncharacterized protein n=1 Tax=Salvia splendens TaxID=180675 RepID=A0A8X8XH11_SALSN|nr:hypothetical protein SASPL_127172 [Salvia splendens]